MTVPAKVEDQIAQLYKEVAELNRRLQNSKRTGKISETDYENGKYRVEFKELGSNGKPYLSPWIPVKEIAMGEIKAHFPLSIGEQVTVVSESGDLSDAEIEGSIPSDDNPRPHNKGGEAVITIGETRLTITGDEVRIKTNNYFVECDSFKVQYGQVEFTNT